MKTTQIGLPIDMILIVSIVSPRQQETENLHGLPSDMSFIVDIVIPN